MGPSNPAHIVSVTSYSPATLRDIIAHLEVSTEFDHLVYREAELDAIWSATGFDLQTGPSHPQRDEIARLHEVAHRAHDLVADHRPREAADLLRAIL